MRRPRVLVWYADDSAAGAEAQKLDYRRVFKVLQSRRAGCGHLCGYVNYSEGSFSVAAALQLCLVLEAFSVPCGVAAVRVEVSAWQFLNPESNLARIEEVVELCKVVTKALKAILSRKRVASWAVSAFLFPVQAFTVHIMQFVGNMYKDAVLYKKYRYILLLQQFDK